ncbi:hypothetical protein [Pseudomonas mosselii]|uniref:hypothetical protein n=1 Tax=Pseudomonas mosselii TaxID=78327 RepID=UPI0027DD6C38|nr:hypothetical protein [Pseudomonas mosselii]
MFSVEHIGTAYSDFFLQDFDSKDIHFSLVRISGGRLDGELLCIRHNVLTGEYAMGKSGGNFSLKAGMGSGGHGSLLRFVRFLKSHCGGRVLNGCTYQHNDMMGIGHHHPDYYLRNSDRSDWLTILLAGQDPDDWLAGKRSAWLEIENLDYGKKPPEGWSGLVDTGRRSA